jgi:hypothetical protein
MVAPLSCLSGLSAEEPAERRHLHRLRALRRLLLAANSHCPHGALPASCKCPERCSPPIVGVGEYHVFEGELPFFHKALGRE